MKLVLAPFLFAVATAMATTHLRREGRRLSDSCTLKTVDFAQFAAGSYLDSASLEDGLTISAHSFDSRCITGDPMIFDTNNPTCRDDDLQSDGTDGNAIIIQEDSSCQPDDCKYGGSLKFSWPDPVNVKQARLLDQDGAGTDVKVKYAGMTTFATLPSVPQPGDGQHVTYDIMKDTVIEVEVTFGRSGGIAMITYETCPRNPRVSGDPHFWTWGGHPFDFHGECDMKLLESKQFANGQGLEIQIRTEIKDWYSFVSDVALRIGNEILEVSSEGRFLFNGDMELPESIAGFPIHYQANSVSYSEATEYIFDIHLNDSEYLRIRSFKNLMYVTLAPGVYHDLSDSVGLMGSWETGQMIGRDGVTELSEEWVFAPEWQVRDTEKLLFSSIRAPQYPTQCVMPSPQQGRRLMDLEDAEAACEHWGSAKKQCVFDVVATGDMEVAKAGY